jgi:hypothetical protein
MQGNKRLLKTLAGHIHAGWPHTRSTVLLRSAVPATNRRIGCDQVVHCGLIRN